MHKNYLSADPGQLSRINVMIRTGFFLMIVFLLSCNHRPDQTKEMQIVDSLSRISEHALKDTVVPAGLPVKTDSVIADNTKIKEKTILPEPSSVNTGNTDPDALMKFAETLVGVPYVWASTDPRVGFDCSGFITYVFNHFNIKVPRSSVDFTKVGMTVPVEQAKRGDLILFTGTNSQETFIGHMGMVVSNGAEGLRFIHATSGKAMAVAITSFNEQYKKRFIRISRVFGQNN
jgi:cell wall-associated NlpC family hydrolase